MCSSSDISAKWSDNMLQGNTLYGGRLANVAFTVQPVRKEDIPGTNAEVA